MSALSEHNETDPLIADAPVEPPLSGRVVRGAGWLFFGKVIGRGLGVIKLVILARLLAPEDFGLFGIAMLALATLEAFTVTGFGDALIHRQGRIRAYLDSAWVVQILRGLCLAALLYFTAPLIGWFFDEPRAVPILRVLCLVEIVKALVNPGIIHFRKELQFRKQMEYILWSDILALIIGVLLAFQLRNVWALVWAALAGTAVRVALSYILHPHRPRLRMNAEHVRHLFGFGGWVLASSLLMFLVTHADDLVVGKVLGAAALGVYQIAFRVANIAATEIAHTINSVLFPAFSKVQSDKKRLRAGYVKSVTVTLGLACPLALGLLVMAPVLVPVLLGEAWRPAVVPMQILALFGLARAFAAGCGSVFYACGQPRLLARVSAIQCVLLALTLWPLTVRYGLPGTSVAVTLSTLLVYGYSAFLTCALLELRVQTLLRTVAQALAPAVLMALGVAWLARFATESVGGLALLVAVGGASFVVLWRLINPSTNPIHLLRRKA